MGTVLTEIISGHTMQSYQLEVIAVDVVFITAISLTYLELTSLALLHIVGIEMIVFITLSVVKEPSTDC